MSKAATLKTTFYDGTTVPRKAIVFHGSVLGRVVEGTFAATAWIYDVGGISGQSLSWQPVTELGGKTYTDHKANFSPMPQKEWDGLTNEQKEAINE